MNFKVFHNMKWKKVLIRKNYVLCLKKKNALKKSCLVLKHFLSSPLISVLNPFLMETYFRGAIAYLKLCFWFVLFTGKVAIQKEDLQKYHNRDTWFQLQHVDADSEVQVR